eukprot:1493731-Alexandrium_andersonii.AAC.1
MRYVNIDRTEPIDGTEHDGDRTDRTEYLPDVCCVPLVRARIGATCVLTLSLGGRWIYPASSRRKGPKMQSARPVRAALRLAL